MNEYRKCPSYLNAYILYDVWACIDHGFVERQPFKYGAITVLMLSFGWWSICGLFNFKIKKSHGIEHNCCA